jgi:hypothetical protein
MQILRTQHMQAVENLLESHTIFFPTIYQPPVQMDGMFRTRIVLNDGRACDVASCIESGRTLISQWVREEPLCGI